MEVIQLKAKDKYKSFIPQYVDILDELVSTVISGEFLIIVLSNPDMKLKPLIITIEQYVFPNRSNCKIIKHLKTYDKTLYNKITQLTE